MKNRRLDIKLTDYELQQLEEEAARRGMTKSELTLEFNSSFSRT